MEITDPRKKFNIHQKKIKTLLEENSRFKRMYDEYDHLSQNLWNLEQSEGISPTDDFIEYIKVQTNCLENEIEDLILERS